jgi:hypothetical protein
LAALLLLCALPALPQDKGIMIPHGFGTGQDYVEMTEAQQRSYAIGFVNGLLFTEALGAPGNRIQWLAACVDGLSDVQVSATLFQYISSHTSEWNRDLHLLSYRALNDTCPGSPANQKKR